MAAGDAVNDVIALGAGASSNLQPAASVELLITNLAGSDTTSANFLMYDGANTAIMLGDWSSVTFVGTVKAFLNNTNYMQIYNSSGSARVLAYSGIQTK